MMGSQIALYFIDYGRKFQNCIYASLGVSYQIISLHLITIYKFNKWSHCLMLHVEFSLTLIGIMNLELVVPSTKAIVEMQSHLKQHLKQFLIWIKDSQIVFSI